MLKRLYIRIKFRRMTAGFDRAIRNAQRRHMPVNHIRQAKAAFLHDCLRGYVAAQKRAA